jgi:hypothetical protein
MYILMVQYFYHKFSKKKSIFAAHLPPKIARKYFDAFFKNWLIREIAYLFILSELNTII